MSPKIERDLEEEVAQLKDKLDEAQRQLKKLSDEASSFSTNQFNNKNDVPNASNNSLPLEIPTLPAVSHALLLLSDSALPLGSFAFSSGLESYLAHNKPLPPSITPIQSYHHFLHLSISSLAGTTIPYVLAAYRCSQNLDTLDNDLDASTPCTVARRASVAQGRALLNVWERALRPACSENGDAQVAMEVLGTFSSKLKAPRLEPLGANGHFAPLWGVVCLSLAIPERQTAYIFLFNHAKAVLSAGVRAAVMGPYQAQGVLASGWLQKEIERGLNSSYDVTVEEAGQCAPGMDFWVGRHELLYSRIFNS